MFHVHLTSKLIAAHVSKDSKFKFDGCSNQWRWAAKRSGDDGGSNRGSTTVANAAISGTSSSYVDDMYRLWLNDKTSVHASWDQYFSANPTRTMQIAGATPNASQLDKNRLVQFVHPKDTDTISEKSSNTSMSIAQNDRPIVIKIDIINDPTGRAPDLYSGESDSVRSNQTVKSEDGVRSAWKQVGTVEDLPQNQHSDMITSLTSDVPPAMPHTQTPKPLHPPQESTTIIPTTRMPSKSVDWQTHVRDFNRVYLQSTGGELSRVPAFKSLITVVPPKESTIKSAVPVLATPKPVTPSTRPTTPSTSSTSQMHNKTRNWNTNSESLKPTNQSAAQRTKEPTPSRPVTPPTSVVGASQKPPTQGPATTSQIINKTENLNTTSINPKPAGSAQETPGVPTPSNLGASSLADNAPPSAKSPIQVATSTSQTNDKTGIRNANQVSPATTSPSKPVTSLIEAPSSSKPSTNVTPPSSQTNNKTANWNTPVNPKPSNSVQRTPVVATSPKPITSTSPGEVPLSPKPPTHVTPSTTQTNNKTGNWNAAAVSPKSTNPVHGTPGNPSPSKPVTPTSTGEASSIPKAPTSTSVTLSSPASATVSSAPVSSKSSGGSSSSKMHAAAPTGGGGGGGMDNTIQQNLAVQGVIRSYQSRGHVESRLDPLGILDKNKTTLEQRKGYPSAKIIRQHKEFSNINLGTSFHLPPTCFIGQGETTLPLGEIIKRLEHAYTHHIGAEFMYIQDMDRTLWIRKQLESPDLLKIDNATKHRTLLRLIRAVQFESFLAKKYTAEKRFGLEGCEALIPCIKEIIDVSTNMGVEGVNIAMPHRGRLNVLANVCRKSLKDIFTTFAGLASPDEGSGDVKYHLGTVVTRENNVNKKMVRLSVVANPSHLEAVGPVCLGKTRAEQFIKGDTTGASILGLYVHGDAAFCGQGVVYESMHLSHLPCYSTHGAIHIVINNQVGFTTDPRFSRSSPYCTDVGRVVLAPIFHVNADDPDDVVRVSRLAAAWRQAFLEDVVIDLVSYRRNGHNEMDEPMFTQPLMYQLIRKHPNVAKIYGDQLIKEGLVQQVEIDDYVKEYLQICEQDFAMAKNEKEVRYRDWLDSPWKGFFKDDYKFTAMPNTGISEETMKHIGKIFSSAPPGDFAIHRGIQRILKNRAKMVSERTTDWSLGEAFAYGSLMKEGYHVRLSGQDVERGTFSHRHHVMHHQTEDMKTFNILANLYNNQAPYTVCNSSLSEYAVLSFEMGYAQVSPYALVMWEGQFGDFANTAQVCIDTYLCSGQSKWFRQCGLVMQLPHGMEGAGPEHSSARLERYLQLCDDDPKTKGPYDEKFILYEHEHCNWFVANCTTPSSLFHILRRQMLLPFRKPLILMTPKSGLRHPRAMSSFDEFLEGRQFQRIIPEAGSASQAPDQVKKLIFCTGKTYFDLMDWIVEAKVESQIAVTRTEQLSPFPYDLVAAEIAKYKNAKAVAWAQEEHMNQGAWIYMQPRINGAADGKISCQYYGRPGACAAATGNKQLHLSEIANYKAQVLNI